VSESSTTKWKAIERPVGEIVESIGRVPVDRPAISPVFAQVAPAFFFALGTQKAGYDLRFQARDEFSG
jgi:hypothetical protein